MKANELRIGNLVYITGLVNRHIEETVISVVKSSDIPLCERNPDNFIPIPLTEEWLLRFGAVGLPQIDSNYSGIGFITNDFYCLEYDKENSKMVLVNIADNYYSMDLPIKYVHKLQNLFYFLTGTELEMK